MRPRGAGPTFSVARCPGPAGRIFAPRLPDRNSGILLPVTWRGESFLFVRFRVAPRRLGCSRRLDRGIAAAVGIPFLSEPGCVIPGLAAQCRRRQGIVCVGQDATATRNPSPNEFPRLWPLCGLSVESRPSRRGPPPLFALRTGSAPQCNGCRAPSVQIRHSAALRRLLSLLREATAPCLCVGGTVVAIHGSLSLLVDCIAQS